MISLRTPNVDQPLEKLDVLPPQPEHSPRRRPVDRATVVMRRAAAYQGFSASSAASSSTLYAFNTDAISAAVSVSVSASCIDGGSPSSSGSPAPTAISAPS